MEKLSCSKENSSTFDIHRYRHSCTPSKLEPNEDRHSNLLSGDGRLTIMPFAMPIAMQKLCTIQDEHWWNCSYNCSILKLSRNYLDHHER